MMQVWHFSEMAYHPGWESLPDGLRNVIPSRVYDPEIGADLYHRYLDEWALCDRLGLNIMVNEHHATATCTTSVCTIPMAILARETQKARLLCLGMPIGNRMDAVRVAEEYAMLDVISRGRVEMGFVKGAPFEINPANSNPAALEERFWEAHDLIVKAMTTHDGPFNWEGRHYHYREVNVWPRPWQQPHPPIWMTVASPGSASRIARKGYVIAALNTGYIHTPVVYGAYRESAAEAGIATGPDRFAYLCIVGVGETEAEGKRRAHQILDYSRTTPRVQSQFFYPPGYSPAGPTAAMIRSSERLIQRRDGSSFRMEDGTVEDYMAAGVAFAGTPAQVVEQVQEFAAAVGGFEHLLMMGQGGFLSHEDTVANLTLFSEEALPAIRGL